MTIFEEIDVRRLWRACHPDLPAKPKHWFEAHATLVLEVDREILGTTSYSVGFAPTCPHAPAGEVMYGHGLCVRPDQRGRGYGLELAEARYTVARSIGIQTFIGMTRLDNDPMRRIFARQAAESVNTVPHAYEDGASALIYVGRVS